MTTDGRVKILDFGLAKRWRRRTSAERRGDGVVADASRAGLLGTVAYMSPEQVRALPVDHRTDIFSFGVVLYELLSGTAPVPAGDDGGATLTAILEETPPELTSLGARDPAGADAGSCGGAWRRSGRSASSCGARPGARRWRRCWRRRRGRRSCGRWRSGARTRGSRPSRRRTRPSSSGGRREVEALWRAAAGRGGCSRVIGPSGAGKTSFVRAGVVAVATRGLGGARVRRRGRAPFRGLGAGARAGAGRRPRGAASSSCRFERQRTTAVDLVGRLAAGARARRFSSWTSSRSCSR